jgi:aspartate/methionine/tyrosine aminotransferase
MVSPVKMALDVTAGSCENWPMQIPPFRIEHYFGKYEFTAKYLLSSSDCESRPMQELLDFERGAQELFLQQWCGYTESEGAPSLRQAIAPVYTKISAENVLVLAAAEEGIFIFYHALAGPGDHIIVETPCYESALTVARSTGAQVSLWKRRAENGWAHDLDSLAKLIQLNTKIVYINTPHNPTGLNMPLEIFQQVMKLAAAQNIVVFSDEVYRELEHDPARRLPAACDLYHRAVSLGSLSKSYGLPGLRLGWLASQDREIIKKCMEFKYYTTICSSAPSEFLATIAVRHREKLIQRNREIVLHNLRLLDDFISSHAQLFSWTKPNAGPIGFAEYKGKQPVAEFCEQLVSDSGLLLLPGTVYDEPGHIRFGYGRKNMPQSLEQLRTYLDSHPN